MMNGKLLLAGWTAIALVSNAWPQTPAAVRPLRIVLDNPTGGEPMRETLPDGSIVVRTEFTQPVTGDVSGMFTERSTQRFPSADEQGLVPITTFWKLETPAGVLEGYYSGLRDRSPDGSRESQQHGFVLTASRAYSAYYETEVSYRLTTSDSGAPRAIVTILSPQQLNNDILGDVGPASPPASLRAPVDATPDADGSAIYFTARNDNDAPAVFSVPANGGALTLLAAGDPLVEPRGIASSPLPKAGKPVFYVADRRAGDNNGGLVFAVFSSGEPPLPVTGTAGYAPLGIEIMRQDGGDVIYFTGRDPHDGVAGVFKIPANGANAPTLVWKGAPLVEPDSVALARNGVVYVSDRAAGGNGRGSVFSINGQTVSRIANGFQPGNPAGLALNRDESLLFVSSLDAHQGTAQVLIIDLATFRTGSANKGIDQNHEAGGLHRAQFSDVFAWADATPPGGRGGTVYHVPVCCPKCCGQ